MINQRHLWSGVPHILIFRYESGMEIECKREHDEATNARDVLLANSEIKHSNSTGRSGLRPRIGGFINSIPECVILCLTNVKPRLAASVTTVS